MLRSLLFLLVITLFVITLASTAGVTNSQLSRLTITDEQTLNLNPQLSADGRIVVFESTADLANVGGASSFHTLRTTVDGRSTFEDIARSRATTLSTSQNGDRVVFASTEDLIGENSDRNSEIYLSTDSKLRQLTHTLSTTESNRLTQGNFEPAISGDGRWVVFVSNRDLSSNAAEELFLFNTETGSINQLTNTDSSSSPSQPKINVDGSHVFFIQRSSGSNAADLMYLDVLTGRAQVVARQLTDLAFSQARSVSNDGNRIVYSATTSENQSQVFIFDLPATVSRQLTNLGTRSTDVPLNPSISGDGKRVTFATRRRVNNPVDGSVELYLFDIATSTIQQLTNAPANATADVTSSLNDDGSLVVFNFPRVLSGGVLNSELGNNSEIYLSFPDPRPQFGEATVSNVANRAATNTQIASDSIAAITGTTLSSRSEQANTSEGNLPFSINGTTVEVNGKRARLIYASPEEVQFVVPENLVNGPAEVLVTNSEGFPSKALTTIVQAAPGLFGSNSDGILLNAHTFLPGPFDPTNNDLQVVIFGTGFRHATEVFVNLGGDQLPIEKVLPSTFPGLDELYFHIPAEFRGAGVMPLSVRAGADESNMVLTNLSGSSVRDIVINEILTDPPDGPVGDANHDGSRDASADEFIELVNTTSRDIDLTGYQLQTRTLTSTNDTVRHRFPGGTIFAAGTALVVFGGGQLDATNPVFGGALVTRASTSGLSLSNSGGVVTLRDPSGVVVNSIRYGATLGIPGDANQSITRSPDVFGTLQMHKMATGNETVFSPGTRVDGSAFLPSPAIAIISLTPSSVELLKGQSIQFSAKALDADNRELADVIFQWTSSNNTVLTVDSSGIAKATEAGKAEIKVRARGIESKSSAVSVLAPTPTPTPTPSPSPSPTPTPVPSPSPAPSLPKLVISELRTRGPSGASDEFIEVYNNSDVAIPLSGLKIRGSSSTGGITTRLTISANTIIPARGHWLAVNSSGYSGNVSGDQSFTSGFANDGGAALTMPDDTIIDQVGFSNGSAFKEGNHLTPLTTDTNQSYERKPGGPLGSTQDTQDNAADFVFGTSDPQNLLSNPTPGPLPSPSPSPTISPSPSPSPTPSTNRGLVISQIFGGGGNSGAPYRNDFIEIFNGGITSVNLTGWSVQYASSTASVWAVTNLNDVTLAPGQYYLVQQAGGSNGQPLPTADAIGTISLAATAGKVALVKTTTPLTGACPNDGSIADLVGYGTTATCFEGSATAPAPGNTTAIIRKSDGCVDTNNNQSDFATAPPQPRNSAVAFNACTGPPQSALLEASIYVLFWRLLHGLF